MDQAFRVFVVDDDEIILTVLREILEPQVQVDCFYTAEDCLTELQETHPDLILLDLNLPGMGGEAFCHRLKDDWETQNIPVIFISANDDMETRLQCYEAGGEDFILKPFAPAEVQYKLQVAQRITASKRQLHEQAGYAQRTAMSVMTSMGELGVVLQFLSKSFACNTAEDLAGAMLDAMRQWDLHAAVQLRIAGQAYSVSGNGAEMPLEVGILNHVRNSGRIFQFKSRCVFNYGNVTLMVNNMPIEDEERAGRIRDNAALLAEGADARLRAIESDLLAQRRREGLEAALPQVRAALESVQDAYRAGAFELTQIMIDFEQVLAKSFLSLGLTDEQEDLLSMLTHEQMQRMIGSQDRSRDVIVQLETLAENLERLIRH